MKCNNREPGRGEGRGGHDPYISGLADKFHSRFAHKWARTCCSSLPTNWKLYCTHYSITSPSLPFSPLLSPFTSQFVFINFAIFPTVPPRVLSTPQRACFIAFISRSDFIALLKGSISYWLWSYYITRGRWNVSRKTQVVFTSLYNVKQSHTVS